MKITTSIPYTPSSEVLYLSLHPSLAGIKFRYQTSLDSHQGILAVNISPNFANLSEIERDLIGSAAALVVAGLFISRTIIVEWDSVAVKAKEFAELLRILYDVRAYCSKSEPFIPSVLVRPDYTIRAMPKVSHTADIDISAHSHILLFSGGIDSTYSLLRMLENGDKPVALFLDSNRDTVDLEWIASNRIASRLDVRLIRCGIVAEGLPERGADPSIWPQFGQYPYYNSIPHGRDIFSAALSSVIASRYGIEHISFGQEKESRDKVISYQGRRILRHDVESREGSALLETWINYCTRLDVLITSPIEDFSISEIRLAMFNQHEHLLAMTQSCFWEQLCGRCVKCISLYLLQRLTGKSPFRFETNPLADLENLDLADAVMSDLPDNEIGYGAQIRDSIHRILKEGKYSREDYWIYRAAITLCANVGEASSPR